MSNLYITKESGLTEKPVFIDIIGDIPGGIAISIDEIPTTTKYLYAGQQLAESENTSGLYQPVKTAYGFGDATALTAFYVRTGHLFNVGDYIAKEGNADSLQSIVSITRGANTDRIVVAATLGTVATGTVLYQAASGDSSQLYKPDCLLKNTLRVREDDLTSLYNVNASGVVRGDVREDLMPNPITAQGKTNITSRIRFAS